jgi:2-polyprenyl-3-methyl-5-hydroxy-6-metoxy-1,4-benzoquinol methylase
MSKYSENMPPSLRGAVEWMIDDIEPGSTVLDFGCSTGYFGTYLKDSMGCTVYGVEISDDIKAARKVLDGVYSFDIDAEWPKEAYERTYDYLFYGDVIEHLKDPEAALKRSQKLLKPGGKIFISTPNVAHLSIRLELLLGNFEYESMGILDNTHLKYFTQHSLTELVKRAGYNVERIDYNVNEYPREVAQKLLDKAGLKATDVFWDIAKTTEARAHQWQLVIVPRRGSTPARVAKPTLKPEQYKANYIKDLTSQITALDNHAKEQAKIIEHYKGKAETAESQIADLTKQLNKKHLTQRLKNITKHPKKN